MTLEEAKDILQNIIADEVIGTYCLEIRKTVNCEENCKNSDCYLCQAIDIVLQALDNSISKDEIRNLRQKYEPAMKHYDCDEASYSQSQNVGAYMVLKRILGE